jgi:SAM-dependent methyltransferase
LADVPAAERLRCTTCNVVFAVRGNIPRMTEAADWADPRMSAEWEAQSRARAQYIDNVSILNRWELQVLPRLVDWLGDMHGPILDVGCGVGHLGNALFAAGRSEVELVGTDFQAELLEEVGTGYLGLVEADVHHLPFRDAAFAGIIASNSLHHFPDPERAMSEIARVLRPGGVFVAYDPRFLAPLEALKKRLRRNDRAFTEDHKAFRLDEYRTLLGSSGLCVTEVSCTDPLGILLATGLDYLKAGRFGLAEPLAKTLAKVDRHLAGRARHTPLGLMLSGRAVKPPLA